MSQLLGALTAIVTPFDSEGAFNWTALDSFLGFQRDAGIDGVVVSGTNGEGVSLSVTERKALLEAVLARRGRFSVVAGVGAASITDAVELARHAGEAGADASLALPPFFFKTPSANGLAAYFRALLDVSTIPVYLYHIPQFSAIAISDEVIDLLRGHTKLAGLKDSAGNWERTSALIKESGLGVFPGADDLMARSLKAGAPGCISGAANAFPDLVVAVHRAIAAGSDAAAEQQRLDAAKKILLIFPLIASSKSVLVRRGVERMWVRPPLVDLTAEQEADLVNKLEEIGLL